MDVAAIKASLYRQTQRREAPTWHARLVAQSGARRHTLHIGGILRTTIFATQPRIQTEKGMPHGPARGRRDLDRHEVVHRRRHQRMLRFCMLMPPSRTRKTCLRSNIAPRLAGENVQHIDMLCISHSVCLYVFNITSYIIVKYMSTENQKNLFISYIIIQIIAMHRKHTI